MLQRFVILYLLMLLALKTEAQQWMIEYPISEYETISLIGGDMSGVYNYSVGYRHDERTDVTHPIAIRVDGAGNYVDKLYDDVVEKGFFCFALGLGDGNAFVVARCGDDQGNDFYEKLWVAVIDPELEILKENYIGLNQPYVSYGLTAQALMNENGEIVIVAQIADYNSSGNNMHYDYAFYKINDECDLLKYSYMENESSFNEITDFTRVSGTDRYAVFGRGMRANGVETVFYIDNDLNYISSEFIDDPNNYPDNYFPKFMCVDHWFDENSFLMSTQSSKTNGINKWRPLILKMDVKMNVLDELNLERIDTTDYVSQFKSMTYIDANTIYVSTFWNVNEGVGPFHNTVTLFLINETLDLLGRCDLFMESFFNVLHIQPTSDKGCIIQGYLDNVSHRKPVMYKFNRIDFEIMTDVLKEEDFSKVSAYPNPVSSVLHIEAAAFKNKYVNVEIFDMLGGRYLDKDVYKDGDILSIDVSLLKDGAYVYCLSDNRQKIKGMFVKE